MDRTWHLYFRTPIVINNPETGNYHRSCSTLVWLVQCLVLTLSPSRRDRRVSSFSSLSERTSRFTQLFLKQSWEQKWDPVLMLCLTQVGHCKWAGLSQSTAAHTGAVCTLGVISRRGGNFWEDGRPPAKSCCRPWKIYSYAFQTFRFTINDSYSSDLWAQIIHVLT